MISQNVSSYCRGIIGGCANLEQAIGSNSLLPYRRALFYLMLIFVILLAYSPSLSHVFRADHWAYLVDTMDYRGTWELVKNTYSYNRTRMIKPGDTALFRPILFTLLAIEKSLFGFSFMGYQIVGLVLHTLIAIISLRLLFHLLDRYRLSQQKAKVEFVLFCALCFFAVNPALQELVIWSHLHGYLLFHLLLLVVLNLIVFGGRELGDYHKGYAVPRQRKTEGGANEKRRAAPSVFRWRATYALTLWGVTLLAVFTYELGQILACLLAGISLFGVQGRKRFFWFIGFLGIVCIYQSLNILDQSVHMGQYKTDIDLRNILQKSWQSETIDHWIRYIRYVLIQPFFPLHLRTHLAGHRLVVNEWTSLPIRNAKITTMVSWVMFLLLIYYSIKGLKLLRKLAPGFQAPIKAVALILLGCSLGYLGLIVFGRMNCRPSPAVLSTNSYYTYIGFSCGLLFLLVLSMLSLSQLKTKTVPWVLGLSIFINSFWGLGKTKAMNQQVALAYAPVKNAVSYISTELSKSKSRVRIAFDRESLSHFFSFHGLPVLIPLFREFEDNYYPTHVLQIMNGQVVLTPSDVYRRQKNLHFSEQLFPRLVKVGTEVYTYEYHGKIYSLGHSENPMKAINRKD